MLFSSKRSEEALAGIALNLNRIATTLELLVQAQVSPHGTGLRTNYTDGQPDSSYFSEVDDTSEFLRDLEEAARIAQGLPPKVDDDREP